MVVGALILLALGLAHETLNARFLLAVRDERAALAGLLSGLLTAFSYGAWALMVWSGVEGTVVGILAYSLGSGLGMWRATSRGSCNLHSRSPRDESTTP